MNARPRVLISGAGIAGLTAAIRLGRAGLRPVVVEHAPDVRADGYIISLSHRSYRYAGALGLLDAIRARAAGITASSYHRGRRVLLRLDYGRLFAGLDVVQIMRDDLQDILFERAREVAEFRFATHIESLAQTPAQVEVRFSDGRAESFDALIGADGAHSNVRRLCFDAADVDARALGLCAAAYRLPNIAGLAHKFETHLERARYLVLFTTPAQALAAVFVWASGYTEAPPARLRAAALRAAFGDGGALVQRVLEHCPATGEFYFDPLVQVRLASWHRGRAVLVGDAAHCMTLISGQGATMAFTGACVLAEALLERSVPEAFAAYERELAHSVRETQQRTRAAARWYVPRTRWRQGLRDVALWGLPSRVFERHFRAKYSRA